jgi:hypothetical protein
MQPSRAFTVRLFEGVVRASLDVENLGCLKALTPDPDPCEPREGISIDKSLWQGCGL